jgi:hypothetical protein
MSDGLYFDKGDDFCVREEAETVERQPLRQQMIIAA